ncbi:glycosyltransferase [Salinarimonas sp.]|uniref:glycosyltransferase n=1 Tax=Salinarimonas sp. TaxID=2766526 RepID=UPI0032D96AB8
MTHPDDARSLPASVVVCTHNPDRALLASVLAAIGAQSLSSRDFEIVVVDNRSSPALDAHELSRMAGRPLRVVTEERPGLTYARVAGFKAARGDIVVFADDDNILDADYVDRAVEVGRAHPEVGVFGGRCRGAFDRPVGRRRKRFAPFLGVRDVGDAELVGEGLEWGPHEPIGAGIVVRPDIGAAYCAYVDAQQQAGAMGRSGKNLMSGEDSFISRIAHCLGYKVGYFPQMALDHVISSRRLELGYLLRLMIGHGRSYVVLHEIVHGHKPARFDRFPTKLLYKDVVYLLRTFGLVEGVIKGLWQYGYYRQCVGPVTPSGHSLADVIAAGVESSPRGGETPDESGCSRV